MNKKVSLKDIAAQLGVSTALVSYVLNNKERKGRVGDEMARKIRQLAISLNYQPNFIAKSLQSGKTNTIGVVVADISNPFFSSIARIIEDEAMKQDYVVVFGSSDENAEKSMRLIDVFINRGVDAFIIAPSENTEKQIKRLQKQQIPVVLIDRYFPDIKSDYVVINNFQAAYNAADHLIKGGRDRIAMLAYDTKMEHMQERIRGYKAALEDNGITFDESWLARVSYQDLGSHVSSAIKGMIKPKLQVNGFFFATNSLAVESLKLLTSSGVCIPDDLAVVSFDESDAFDLFYSPVSYVSQSLYDIGKGAIDLALSRIKGESHRLQRLIIEARLVVRESSSGKESKKGSFGYDLEFLSRFDDPVLLESGKNRIIVSPKYQAKVFTSTSGGNSGRSYGWVNYKAFGAPLHAHMNAYGGENRLWLGPEGGKYSLFFQPGDRMEFSNWHAPAPFDTEPWEVTFKSHITVGMAKNMELLNYAGTLLKLRLLRTIQLLEQEEIRSLLNLPAGEMPEIVGYRTENTITNTGDLAWTESTGAPCIWILDMFNPSEETVIVVPLKKGRSSAQAVTSDYFGPIPSDRLRQQGNVLFLKADGRSRGKLGVRGAMTLPVAGSYDYKNQVLTIVMFDVDPGAKYLNQEWDTAKPVFSGDAVNAYNDGPLDDGQQMGPFFELESVSPAAFLNAGASLSHQHSVFHISGDEPSLDVIAGKVLGVSLKKIKASFIK